MYLSDVLFKLGGDMILSTENLRKALQSVVWLVMLSV